MTDIIQLLPDHVANQIAAGEVVQRPASVVKELLENAIDAGATEIKLVVKDAGKTLVQVLDNGSGMSMTDARLCFERHATSKIQTADDLFNLHTKGFRGEALASIAAIAHVELKTKTQQSEIGTKIVIEGSEVQSHEAEVVPVGTSISVKNLFYNIPARRNFLKSNPVESRHIIDEFQRVALAHPDVHFEMIHNGADIFNLPASNSRQRIVNIFGNKSNEKLVPVSEATEIVKVSGFVMKPAFAKKSRGEQFFFVNGRFVRSPYLHHAINAAFEGLVKEATHPGYFLFLEVDPKSIDINIHPTKTEVKFDDEHAIYAMLKATIKHSLGQFSIAPVLDFNKDSSFDTPYAYKEKTPVAPSIDVDRNYNPFQEGKQSSKRSYASTKGAESSWESLYVGLKDISEKENIPEGIAFESEEVTGSFFEEEQQPRGTAMFQIQNKYIISSIKSGIMVVHQHLAHQRILYEELLKNMTLQEAVSQQLLFPVQFEYEPQKVQLLITVKEQLEQTGFVFEVLEGEAVKISGLPAGVPESKVDEILESICADLTTDVPDAGFSQNDLLAKSLAKNLAIRTGTALLPEEQLNLIDQLFACKEPSVSPNNEPVLITLAATDFDKRFM